METSCLASRCKRRAVRGWGAGEERSPEEEGGACAWAPGCTNCWQKWLQTQFLSGSTAGHGSEDSLLGMSSCSGLVNNCPGGKKGFAYPNTAWHMALGDCACWWQGVRFLTKPLPRCPRRGVLSETQTACHRGSEGWQGERQHGIARRPSHLAAVGWLPGALDGSAHSWHRSAPVTPDP